MTCRQIREDVENFEDRDLSLGSFPAEILAHLNGCAECKHFVAQRRELALTLRRFRESAPETPTTLDVAILDAFRKRLSAPKREFALHKTVNGGAICTFSAALLAIVILISLLPGRKVAPRIANFQAPQANAVHKSSALPSNSAREGTIKQADFELHRKLAKGNSRRAAIADNHSLPSGFMSLMYCDRLSCVGDMEIVQVQLSPSMLGLPPGQADATGIIRADVLVGLDGIARGIRLDQ